MAKPTKHIGIVNDIIIERVYNIFNLVDEYIYIGSTTKTLTKRWGDHMYSLNKDENMKLFKHMQDIEISNFRMDLLEWKVVDNLKELRMLDQNLIEGNNPALLLNSKNASGRNNKAFSYQNIEELDDKIVDITLGYLNE